MFPPFSEKAALEACNEIISQLESGSLKMEQVTRESQERAGQGVMIGSLICTDEQGLVHKLFTVSGISKKIPSFGDFTFVEPIVSANQIEAALKKNDLKIHQLTEKINNLKKLRKQENGRFLEQSEEEKQLVKERSILTNESLLSVYDLYSFYCIDGKKRSLVEICRNKLPPTGTGDCCEPKLLNYAFKNGFTPLSMAQVYYGGDTESKKNGEFYPPCDERCSILLPFMLGLKILYRDDFIVVVDKQSGLLSVPGRGPEKQDCIVNRLKKLYPQCIQQPSVHRLDMETSGLLVLALDKDAHRELNRQFENREVSKEYRAVLDGKVLQKSGKLQLYFRVDLDNRPHQIWDAENGKLAVTEYEVLGYEKYTAPDGSKRDVTRVRFIPHTGRTHQLRLASSDSHGIGLPIIGDTLYGKCEEGERLLLHACFLSFTHPVTKEKMDFYCPEEF